MAVSFTSTLRSLEADRASARRSRAIAALALVGLGAWGSWFAAAPVDLHEVSASAQIEVGRAAHRAEAASGGRVVAVEVALGAHVELGDVLVVLDSAALRAERDELQARHDAIGPQLDATRREVEAHRRMIAETRRESRTATTEARARRREAAASARFSAEEARRMAMLHERGLLPELDALRVRSSAEGQRAELDALRVAVRRERDQQRVREQEHDIEIARLERQLAERAGEQRSLAASLARIERRIAEHTILAPVRGRVGAIAPLRSGSYVEPGEEVATIVPDGALRAVAEFSASDANGRLRVGQTASMVLDGYPAVEFGHLEARVASVGNEAREGRVRVELELGSDRIGPGALEHGMTGTVRVRVERVTPLALVLRALGGVVTPRPDRR